MPRRNQVEAGKNDRVGSLLANFQAISSCAAQGEKTFAGASPSYGAAAVFG
jgi:hypothetical protein